MSRDSSNTAQSDASRVATMRQGSTENVASSSPNEAYRLPSCETPIVSHSASTLSTKPKRTSVTVPFRYDVTLSGVLDLFQIENFSNASEEEVIFLFSLYSDLCTAAKNLAKELDGKADRAYQAVLVTLCKENVIS